MLAAAMPSNTGYNISQRWPIYSDVIQVFVTLITLLGIC
jgi:hypothetical protein